MRVGRAAAASDRAWRALESVGRVLDVALRHVHDACTSQLPRHKPEVNGLGANLARQVEAVGKNVTRFRPGDEVFAVVENWRFEYNTIRLHSSLA